MTRSEEVHSKGFDLFGSTYSLQDIEDPLAYRKIKVGLFEYSICSIPLFFYRL